MKESSSTAYLIAWGRSQIPELSHDPYASLWLTENGTKFARELSRDISPSLAQLFGLRHRWIIEQLIKFQNQHLPFTLVNIGCGLTSYPFLLDERVEFIELDQPHVIDYRKEKIQHLVNLRKLPIRKIDFIPSDLKTKEGLHRVLKIISAQSQPYFLLLEGILTYLPHEYGMEIIRHFSQVSPPDSQLIVHVFMEGSPYQNNIERLRKYMEIKLQLPDLILTHFRHSDWSQIVGLNLLESKDFIQLEKEFIIDSENSIPENDLIDERFFLFKKN